MISNRRKYLNNEDPKKRFLKYLNFFLVVSVFFAVVLSSCGEGDEAEIEKIPDSKLQGAVQNQIDESPAIIDTNNIKVDVRNGIVTLSGKTEDLLSRRRAELIAESVRGVRSVVNNIEVDPTVIKPDSLIEVQVRHAMAVDPVIDTQDVKVNAKGTAVILNGNVESHALVDIAKRIAMSVSGVRFIIDSLNITYPEERPDADIKKEIRRKIDINPFIYSSMMEVQVKDGHVKLVGAVGSMEEKSKAFNEAWVNGVESVNISDLEVRFWANEEMKKESLIKDLSNEEKEDAIADALLLDPRLDDFDLTVDVQGRAAILGGKVDRYSAKVAAERDARNTIGITAVDNNIEVIPEAENGDEEIAREAVVLIDMNPLLEKEDINIAVKDNMAILKGAVSSYFQKMTAESVVSKVPGIKAIENEIVIGEPTSDITDKELRQSIENEYYWDVMLEGDQFDISVENGVASIEGKVESWEEYNAAIENAFEGGAYIVKSKINVMDSPYNEQDYHYHDYYYWLQ